MNTRPGYDSVQNAKGASSVEQKADEVRRLLIVTLCVAANKPRTMCKLDSSRKKAPICVVFSVPVVIKHLKALSRTQPPMLGSAQVQCYAVAAALRLVEFETVTEPARFSLFTEQSQHSDD